MSGVSSVLPPKSHENHPKRGPGGAPGGPGGGPGGPGGGPGAPVLVTGLVELLSRVGTP